MIKLRTIKELSWRLRRHHTNDTAAVLAFYALLSLPPFLVLSVTIAAWTLDQNPSDAGFETQLIQFLGNEVAAFTIKLLGSFQQASAVGWGGGIVVPLFILLGAGSQILSKLRQYLTEIFHTEPLRRRRPLPVRLFWRLVVGAMLLALALLAILSTVLNSVAGRTIEAIGSGVSLPFFTVQLIQTLLGAVMIWMTASVLLKVLPSRRPSWRAAAIGALLTAPALVLFKYGLELYFRHALLASILGSGLALVALSFWLYLSMATLLVAAELAAIADDKQRQRAKAEFQTRSQDQPGSESSSSELSGPSDFSDSSSAPVSDSSDSSESS